MKLERYKIRKSPIFGKVLIGWEGWKSLKNDLKNLQSKFSQPLCRVLPGVKWFKAKNQLYLKNELRYEIGFWVCDRHTVIDLFNSMHLYVYSRAHLDLQFVKFELNYDTDFWVLVYIYRNSKMIQSFQVVQWSCF